MKDRQTVSRRNFLKIGVGVLAASLAEQSLVKAQAGSDPMNMDMGQMGMTMPGPNGEVDHQANGFNPTQV